MSLNARESKRVTKPALPILQSMSGQVTFSRGYLPQEKKPEPSRFAIEFEEALEKRAENARKNSRANLRFDRKNLELPKRLDRRIRNAKGRVARAALKVAIATKRAELAHGDATEAYVPSLKKAELKLTYRELQLAGKQLQARALAKQHQLN
jgi:hypothetical protein